MPSQALIEESVFLRSLPEDEGQRVFYGCGVTIDRKLSEGALSNSYLGTHLGLNHPVIVRVMKPEFSRALGETTAKGLLETCRQYARVRHESLTAVYDVATCEDHRVVVIEYVSGVPLMERIRSRPLNEVETLRIFVPIAEALAALWRADFMHRGVSPHRIRVDNDGIPKLDVVILPRIPLEKMLTAAHKPFMAGFWPPEELKGALDIDPRSDIFSFGASMFFALTGQTPYDTSGKCSLDSQIANTLSCEPRDLKTLKPDISEPLHDFIMRCLKCDRAERFDSIGHFMASLHELEANVVGQPLRPRSTFGPGIMNRKPQTGVIGAGTVFGQCVLEAKVGAGAFGVVYRGRHRFLDMPVAVKLLPVELATKYPEYIGLFLREARTAIRIRHKNVIGLYEAGEENGQYYLIMEFAAGGTVSERMVNFPQGMPFDESVRVIREAALGLAAAEEMNIIHRDIKPSNLMYGTLGEIKIADLGLAKRVARPHSPESVKESIRAEQLTMLRGDDSIQGTPAYMAPEMAVSPDKVDHRADLYSLGVTAFNMLTGRLPFEGTQPLQLMVKHATQAPPPPRSLRADIPEHLEAVLLKLLEKSPDKRFQSARQLAEVLV